MTIITSGVHYFDKQFRPGRRVLFDIAGTTEQFDGATITIGYKGADLEFSPCLKPDGTSVTITSRGGFGILVPRSGTVGISLSAAPAAGGIIFDVIQAEVN